jgi:hypothetical protein
MNQDEKPIPLTYQEREAIHVLRKSLKTKPRIASLLLQGATREIAASVLFTMKKELHDLMVVNRAFMEAASALVKIDEQQKETSSDSRSQVQEP